MIKKRPIVLTAALIIIILIISAGLFVFKGYIFAKLMEKTLLKAGRPLKFGTYTVLIDKIAGNQLSGIKITGKNRKLEAKSGDYVYVPQENTIKFNLTDGAAEETDAKDPGAFRRLTFKQLYMKIRLKSPGPE